MIKKKCCPIWAILAAIMVLIAIAVLVYCVLKKLNMLGHSYQAMDEGFWPEEGGQVLSEKDTSGVRYTTDKDFV